MPHVTEPETPPPPFRIWQYPIKKWPREETFWREMTTRTLSALLAAGVIALIAVIAGLGTPEQRVNVLRAVGIVIAAAIVFAVLGYVIMRFLPRRTVLLISPERVVASMGRGRPRKRFILKGDKDCKFWMTNRELIYEELRRVPAHVDVVHFAQPAVGFQDFRFMMKYEGDEAWIALD
jgi:hypothetical protein